MPHDLTPNDLRSYLPLLIVLSLPVLACLAILFLEPGVNRSLFYDAVKTGVVLVIAAGILSYGASRFLGDR